MSGLFLIRIWSRIRIHVYVAISLKELLLIKIYIWLIRWPKSDSQLVIPGLNRQDNITSVVLILGDVHELASVIHDISFRFVKQSANSVAYLLARDAVLNTGFQEWHDVPLLHLWCFNGWGLVLMKLYCSLLSKKKKSNSNWLRVRTHVYVAIISYRRKNCSWPDQNMVKSLN